MTTKIPAELSSTPSITDAGTASIDISGSSDPIFKMQGSGHPQLRLKTTGTTDNTSVDFGDSDSETVGRLLYNHANNYLQIQTGSSTRARIDSDGLKFGSDTAAANALDDYEEGTWTPVHGGNNMTGTATYTKIGRYVYIAGDVTSATGSSTSSTISGLPFTVLSSHHHGSFVVGWTTTGVQGGYVLNAGTSLEAVNAGTNTADTIAAGGRIIFAASYITA